MNPYEAAAFVSGLAGVYLTVKENIWCWPIGVVNVGLLAFVFWESKLYADAGLQLVYVALCLYGWWAWLHGGRGGGVLRVSRPPRRVLLACAFGGAAFAAALGFALRKTDAALPFWDAGTTSFSLVAQWMQARKWLENWVVWIAVDVVYVGMYVVKRIYLTAFLYGVFVALAALGWWKWTESARLSAESREGGGRA
jgi:nicotinamide mononucleotide transporter